MINLKNFSLLIIVFSFLSCSDKYLSFVNRYQFKSPDGKPDYSDLNYWAAHPWKRDPSDSIPKSLRNEKRDTLVDVFFLHPTVYTMKMKEANLNAEIDDAYLNAKTDYSAILYQASAFNEFRLFAPRYRQAHLRSYYSKSDSAKIAFETAYSDIKNAFEYYLRVYNHGRPIIIAAHSQGSTHGMRLVKEFFEDKPLAQQLVAGYLVGMYIPADYFNSLKVCADSIQTSCICAWRTYRAGYTPGFVQKEKTSSLTVNPLSWNADDTYVSQKYNKGSLLRKFNVIYPNTADAKIHKGMLWTERPDFPGSWLLRMKNYHIADINLYYMNIRENLRQRVRAFEAKR